MANNEYNIISNVFGGIIAFFVWLKTDASIYTFLTFIIIYGLITFALGVLIAKARIVREEIKKCKEKDLKIKEIK